MSASTSSLSRASQANYGLISALGTASLPAPSFVFLGEVRSRRAPSISATILTKDSAFWLPDVLKSLEWCDEIVILDTGSSDDTLAIAGRHPKVSLHRLAGPFPGFGRAHHRAVALARNDWNLSIDSDEIVSTELTDEIMALPLDPCVVYSVPFHNFFNYRRITSCGWSPDRHARLFNRTATNFCEDDVHEKVQTEHLAVQTLHHPIRHYSYESLDDYLRKMRSYGLLFAEQNAGRKSSRPAKAMTHSVWAFLKSYVLQRGCLQGYEGLVISAYKAHTAFWKYLLLHEANRRCRA